VKFQCHVYKDEHKKRSKKRHAWIKRNEKSTPLWFWRYLKKYCDAQKVELLITPMSTMAARKINHLVSRWKIGSADITDMELLDYISSTGKPVIMSTGMSTEEEVAKAIQRLENVKVDLLLCNSIYPCPIDKLNLNAVGNYTGFSDHSLSTLAPAIAVAKGASIVEKHFTISRESHGPDHKVSLEPHEFGTMVQNIRQVEQMLGSAEKVLYPEELELIKTFRA